MKISIITATNNSEKTIIRNVHSIINQTNKDFEHIIIDNLSKDNTIQLVENAYREAGLSEKIKIISEVDYGISDAFNKGILNSRGDVIGILNSDDHFYNEFVLEKVQKEFENEEVLFVHGDIFFYDNQFGSNLRRPLLCPITHAMPYNHPTMFFKRYIYEKYGLFDTSYKYAMDFEFVCRMEKMFPLFRNKGKYISREALVVMCAGGESWKHELKSIKEVKRALQQYNFWNTSAFFSFLFRIIRTQLKRVLSGFKLNLIVYLWRSIKWSRQN
jgi:glycosyltransferase involved in cell wall biosynthesis